MTFTARTILITGGTSGIGRALAERLADDNQVIVCARDEHKLDHLREACPSIDTVRCDIANAGDLDRLVAYLGARHPTLDTVFANAGIQQFLDLTAGTVTDEDVDREISINLTAQINLTQRLYPLLRVNQTGMFIVSGSGLGLVAKYDVPVYSATKAGLHSFVQSLRHQAASDGIRVCEVFPDVVRTAMTENRDGEIRMSASDAAHDILTQLGRAKRDVYLGRTGALALMSRLVPGVAARIINR